MQTGQLRLRVRGAIPMGLAYFVGQVVAVTSVIVWLVGSSLWQIRHAVKLHPENHDVAAYMQRLEQNFWREIWRSLVALYATPEAIIGWGIIPLAFILGWILVVREVRHKARCIVAALIGGMFITGSECVIDNLFPLYRSDHMNLVMINEFLYSITLTILFGLGIRWLGAWSRSATTP